MRVRSKLDRPAWTIVASSEWMCDLSRADRALTAWSSSCCGEVVGPMVKADEQTRLRLFED